MAKSVNPQDQKPKDSFSDFVPSVVKNKEAASDKGAASGTDKFSDFAPSVVPQKKKSLDDSTLQPDTTGTGTSITDTDKNFLEQDITNTAIKEAKNRKAIDTGFGAIPQMPMPGFGGATPAGQVPAPAAPKAPLVNTKDFDSIKAYAERRRKELTEEIKAIEARNTHRYTGSIARNTHGAYGDDTWISDTPELKEKKQYLDRLNKSIANIGVESIIAKKYGDKQPEIAANDLKELGKMYKQLQGDYSVDDNVSTAKKVSNRGLEGKSTQQAIEADMYLAGREAAAKFLGSQIEKASAKNPEALGEAIELSRFAIRNKDQEARYKELLQDKQIADAVTAYDKMISLDKKFESEFAENFPHVVKEQVRIAALNAFKTKSKKEAGIFKRVANAIVGQNITNEDIPEIAKQIGVSEDKLREVQEELRMGMGLMSGRSALSTRGFLGSIASGVDQIVSGAQQGLNRLFLSKEEADARNAVKRTVGERYTAGPESDMLFTKDGINLNLESVLNTMGETTGQLAAFVVPNMAGAKIVQGVEGMSAAMGGNFAKSAVIAPKLQKDFEILRKAMDFAMTTSTGTLSSYEDAYQEASKYTANEAKRHSYATMVSGVTGLSENILSPTQMVAKLRGAKLPVSFREFERAVKREGFAKTYVKNVASALKEGGQVIKDEVLEEIVPLFVSYPGKAIINSGEEIKNQPTLGEFANEFIETIVQTAIGTSLLGAGTALRAGKDKSRVLKESLFEAGINPEKYVNHYQTLADENKIDQNKANEHIQAVNTMAKIIKGLPEIDAKGNPLTLKKAIDLAAQEFRKTLNKKKADEVSIESAKAPFEAEIADAEQAQAEILSGEQVEAEKSEPEKVVESVVEKLSAIENGEELPTLTPEEKEVVIERPEDIEAAGVDLFDSIYGDLQAELTDMGIPVEVVPGENFIDTVQKTTAELDKAIEQVDNDADKEKLTEMLDNSLAAAAAIVPEIKGIERAIEPEVTMDDDEAIRLMRPFTDEMADIERQFENEGLDISPDYDNEIQIIDKKTGDIVEFDELPDFLAPVAEKYAKAVGQLSGYSETAMQKALKASRGAETVDAEVVDANALPDSGELSQEKKDKLKKANEEATAAIDNVNQIEKKEKDFIKSIDENSSRVIATALHNGATKEQIQDTKWLSSQEEMYGPDGERFEDILALMVKNDFDLSKVINKVKNYAAQRGDMSLVTKINNLSEKYNQKQNTQDESEQENEAEPVEGQGETKSVETIITQGTAAIEEADNAKSDEERIAALDKIEAAISAIDAKVKALTRVYPTGDIDHEYPNYVVGKAASKELNKIAKLISEKLGWEIESKGPNIAPAGGEVYATFVDKNGNPPFRVFLSARFDPEYNNRYENYTFTEFFIQDRPLDKGSSASINHRAKDEKELLKVLRDIAKKYLPETGKDGKGQEADSSQKTNQNGKVNNQGDGSGSQEASQGQQAVQQNPRQQDGGGQDRRQQEEVLGSDELTQEQRDAIVNRIVALVREYNNTPANRTKQLSSLSQSIASLASKIDATVQAGDTTRTSAGAAAKRTIQVVDSNGKTLKATRVPVTAESLEGRSQLVDYSEEFQNFFDAILPSIKQYADAPKGSDEKIELDMPVDKVRSAIKAIESGKYNGNAFDLLESLASMYEIGLVPFVRRTGSNKDRIAVPVDYFTTMKAEAEAAIENELSVWGGLDPMTVFNLPESFTDDLDELITEQLGDEWTPEELVDALDTEPFQEMFDNAITDDMVEAMLYQSELIQRANELLPQLEQINPFTESKHKGLFYQGTGQGDSLEFDKVSMNRGEGSESLQPVVGNLGEGYYFDINATGALSYALNAPGNNTLVKMAFLDMRNPFVLGTDNLEDLPEAETIVEAAQQAGFDSIISGDQHIVFDKSQIRRVTYAEIQQAEAMLENGDTLKPLKKTEPKPNKNESIQPIQPTVQQRGGEAIPANEQVPGGGQEEVAGPDSGSGQQKNEKEGQQRVKTIEEKAIEDMLSQKQAELQRAQKELKAKAAKLDKEIKKNNTDLFGGTEATKSPLGFDDIDLSARMSATKAEREKVERLKQDVYDLAKKLEAVTGTPSAQADLFDTSTEPVESLPGEFTKSFFGVPNFIGELGAKVSDIVGRFTTAQGTKDSKVDSLKKEFDKVAAEHKAAKSKEEKANLNTRMAAISDEAAQLEADFMDEYNTVFDLVATTIKDKLAQSGTTITDDKSKEVAQEFFDAMFDRPSDAIWNMSVGEVLDMIVAENMEVSKDAVSTILNGDYSLDDLSAVIKSKLKDTFENRSILSSLLAYFKSGDIDGMVDFPDFQSYYGSFVRQAFVELFGNDVPFYSGPELFEYLKNKHASIYNPVQYANNNQGGSSTSTGANRQGRKSDNDNDQRNTTGEVQARNASGDAGAISGESGGQLYPADEESVRNGQKQPGGVGGGVARTDSRSGLANYRQPIVDQPASFSKVKRYQDNINALRMLLTLQKDGRFATPEEQPVLAKYVGFGGLKEILNNPKDLSNWSDADLKYKDQVTEIVDLLNQLDPTGAFLQEARKGILFAHYTPSQVIDSIWYGLNKAGFNKGRVLEPAAGIGNFITFMPEGFDVSVTAVEPESISAMVLSNLLPKAKVVPSKIEVASLPKNAYDVVISNVPFAQVSVYDKELSSISPKHKDATGSIHNYFFAKAMQLVRPGGIVAFITSRYTMDSTENKAVRELIADEGQFLGAIRMPDNTFKGNAGTEVVTDLIFIRKYNEGEQKIEDQPFLNSSKHELDGAMVNYNNYFKLNPTHVIGTPEMTTNQYGETYNVRGDEAVNAIGDRMKEIIDRIIPEPFYKKAQGEHAEKERRKVENYARKGDYQKVGNIIELANGEFGRVTAETYIDEELDNKARSVGVDPYRIRNGNQSYYDEENLRKIGLSTSDFDIRVVESVRMSKEAKERMPQIVSIRNLATTLLQYELEDYSDDIVEMTRTQLRDQYNRFVSKYGRLNEKNNQAAIKHDADQFLIYSLERKRENGSGYEPSDILSKRTLKPKPKVVKIDNLADAILVSYERTGGVDMEIIASLLGKSIEDILAEDNNTQIFKQPDGTFVTADEYLSGNVKKKLAQAKAANMYANVEALEKVIPEDIVASDIYSPLGSRWVPVKYFSEFLTEVLKTPVTVKYSKSKDAYEIDFSVTAESSEYAVDAKKYSERFIISHAMNSVEPVVKTYPADKNDSPKFDEKGTAIAIEKYRLLRERWDNWKFTNEARREHLQKIYNDSFNTNVDRNFDGSHMSFPGLIGFNPRPHQKDGVWRFLQNEGGIADHIVGGGKSLVMMGVAMEGRRLGKIKKPMIIGLKSQIPGFVEEFKKAYPLAKILAPTESDFKKENRKKLLNAIATNDWDCIMITHDQFRMIPSDPEAEADILKEHIQDIEDDIDTETDKNKKKTLMMRLEKMQERIQELMDLSKDQDVITFGKLGIDFLQVDESQEFKNLQFTTRKTNVRGLGNPMGSKKAFDLLVKIRTIQKMHNGDKGVLFASGTPISNTMSELYLLMKYLRPSRLAEQGIKNFDQWVDLFGVNSTELEFYMGRHKEVNRMRKFVNLPELLSDYRAMADVRNKTNLVLPRPEAVHKLVKLPPSTLQLDLIKKLQRFVDSKGNDFADYLGLTAGYDEQKKINPSAAVLAIGYAKKLSLDPRMLGFNEAGRKIAAAADNIFDYYNRTTSFKGTQLVFCDLGTPKNKVSPVQNLREYVEDNNIGLTASDIEEIFGNEEAATKPTLKQVKERMLAKDESGNPVYLDIGSDEFDAMVKEASTIEKFNAYQELKKELISKGIPEEEIVFIHDYDTRVKRLAMFEKMRAGEIRVCIGSTKKMGVGVNVQDRIVAMHHLDITWKPSDLDQRNGRGERQGNWVAEKYMGNKVDVLYYATERTLDASMYELVSTKAKFISQIKVTNDSTIREMEDIEEEIGADAMAAELSGDPIYKERATLQKKIKELETQKRAFDSEYFSLSDKIKNTNTVIEALTSKLDKSKIQLETLRAVNTQPYQLDKEDLEEMTKFKEKHKAASEQEIQEKEEEVIRPKTMTFEGKRVAFKATVDGRSFNNSSSDFGGAFAKVLAEAEMRYPIRTNEFSSEEFFVGKVNGVDIYSRIVRSMGDKEFIFYFKVDGSPIHDGSVSIGTGNQSMIGTIIKRQIVKFAEDATGIGGRLEKYKQDVKIFTDRLAKMSYPEEKENDLKQKRERLKEVDSIIRKKIEEEKKAEQARKDPDSETGISEDMVEERKVQYLRTASGDQVAFVPMSSVYSDEEKQGLGEAKGSPQLSLFSEPTLMEEEDVLGISKVEREFVETNFLPLTGKQKIESYSDVAWMFRALEDRAVEHLYAVHVKDNGEYLVQHVSIGNSTSTVFDTTAVFTTAKKFGGKKLYIIHNHPSGNLKASKEDLLILNKSAKFLEADNIRVEGIIINVTSGKYLMISHEDVLNQDTGSIQMFLEDIDNWKPEDLVNVPTYSFARQHFLKGTSPVFIRGSKDVAAFLSTRRYGAGKKTEMIVLSRANEIVSKVSIPFSLTEFGEHGTKGKEFYQQTKEGKALVKKLSDMILLSLSESNASSVILSGNERVSAALLSEVNTILSKVIDGSPILDYLVLDGIHSYTSYLDDGYLSEPEAIYNQSTQLMREPSAEGTVEDKLNTLAFVSLVFKKMSKNDFIELHKQFQQMDGRQFRLAYEAAESLKGEIEASFEDAAAMDSIKRRYDYTKMLDAIGFYEEFLYRQKNPVQKTQQQDQDQEDDQQQTPPPPPPPTGGQQVPDGEGDDDLTFLDSFAIPHRDIQAVMQTAERLDAFVGNNADDTYFIRELSDLGGAGDSMIQMAKDRFGGLTKEFVPPLLRILETGNWTNQTKKIILAGRVIKALGERINAGDKNPDLQKYKKRAINFFTKSANDAALSLNAVKELYRTMVEGDFSMFYTKEMLDKKQRALLQKYQELGATPISDEVAAEGVKNTDEEISEAQKKIIEKAKKAAAQAEKYQQKATIASKKMPNLADIANRLKNLKC